MSENDPSNTGSEGDPFGFLETFSENSEESSEKIGDVEKVSDEEKERRERIIDNRNKYSGVMEAIREANYPNNISIETYITKGFYAKQTPLIIKDKEKSELWAKEMSELRVLSNTEEYRKICSAECMEMLALGGDIDSVCEKMKKNARIIPITIFDSVLDIAVYADRGKEVAEFFGLSEIDWKNEDTKPLGQAFGEVLVKLGSSEKERDEILLWANDSFLENCRQRVLKMINDIEDLKNDSSDVIDDAEKERREKIVSNRKTFEQDKEDCEKKEEALYEEQREFMDASGLRNHELDKAIVENRKALRLREAEFYREQAPLLIKDEEKREKFLKMINECAESRFGFHPDERVVEECLEVVGAGGDISAACEYIKKNADAGNDDDEAYGAYSLIEDIMEYADWGQELAERVGYVELDFENGSPEENDKKVREIFEKL